MAVQVLQAVDAPTEPEQFLAHLNELRKEKGLTFDRLGRMCQQRPELKLSRSGIYKMLTCKQWPTYQQMAAFLYLCDVPPPEYRLWLTALAYGRGIFDPDFMPESVLLPQPDPVRSLQQGEPQGAPQQPPLPPHPREFRRRWYQRTLAHFALSVFVVMVVVVTAGVIALHVAGVSPQYIAVTCVGAASGVFTWTYAHSHPDVERLSRYARGDIEVFWDYTITAPPVIGDV